MRRLPSAVLAVAALAAVAPAPAGGVPGASPVPETFGPALGNVRYRGELRFATDGLDTDVFSSRLAAGERLSARVVSPFQSPLFPSLEVLGPDGSVRPVELVSRGYGKRLEFREFVIPETGRWTVRIGSILETQGKYTLTLGVRAAPPVRIDVPPDAGGGAPALAELRFEAVEGATLDLRATSAPNAHVEIAALRDPSGSDVRTGGGPAVLASSAKRGGVGLRVTSLGTGDGTYVATLTAAAGHGGFSAVARVSPPERARGTKRLAPDEPWIRPLIRPLRGVHERTIRVQGLHLPVSPVPTVLIGGLPCTELFVEPFGTYMDVAPPVLPEDALYELSIVLADGQSVSMADYLYYVPRPRADAILDASGAAVAGGSTEGGRTLRISGAHFQTGIFLSFGGSADVLPLILGDDLIQVVTPPHAAGVVEVHVLDAYMHDVIAAVPFEYKVPPSFSFAPYTPATVVAGVSTPMVIAGNDFERTDVVLFDGVEVPTAWISDSRLTFTVPPSAAGAHSVQVADRVGTVVNAPSLVVQ